MASEFTLVGQGRATYYASARDIPISTVNTDVFTLTGAPGRRVTPIVFGFSGVAAADTTRSVAILKREQANTGGTSTVQSAVRAISSHPPPKAVVRAYSANPSSGGGVVEMVAKKITLSAPGGTVGAVELIFDFRADYRGQVELLSDQELLALSLLSVSNAGGLLDAWVCWTEEYAL